MSDTHWEDTAQMFGSLFEKPKMTEKLLSKPPFKYLFDIIFATIKTQGFAKKLYNEEETSAEFYDTKEKKIYFLRKMIAVVSLMNKEEVEAKPNKIVAGVEPDKTNLFLQAMYKACCSGDDSGPYVKKVLAKLAKEEAAEAGGGSEQPQAQAEEVKQEAPKQEAKPEKKKKEPAPEPPKEEEKPKPKAKEPEPKPEKKEQPAPPPQTKAERPGTASKRPPKNQSNVQVVEENRSPAGVAGIIREDKNNNQDDDAFFVNKAPAAQPTADLNAEGRGAFVKNALKDAQPQEPEKPQEEAPQQGQKIVMKKRIGQGAAAKQATAEKTDPSQQAYKGGAVGSTSEAGPSQSEVEVIQKLIQSLSQNVNPLKKSIDFINDDIESMNKEMEFWRSQYLASKTKYQAELAATEEQLQPLQNKLAEIEEQIKDKKFRIQASKSSILQNEHKIHKLLYSVVSNK